MKFPKGIWKTKPPMFSYHRGRTWGTGYVTLPDDTVIKCHYDITWGTRFYFEFDSKWYVGEISKFDSEKDRYSITPDLRS